tara:strand:+ start:285 stop:491 length:207 start_codon:yes stop_codon:yes gene_type:complete
VNKNSNYITSEKKSSLDNNLEIDKIKTTNVNILLNRVRLDQKRTLKRRIGFSVIIAIMVSSLAVYFII